jgi:hypothetical protein
VRTSGDSGATCRAVNRPTVVGRPTSRAPYDAALRSAVAAMTEQCGVVRRQLGCRRSETSPTVVSGLDDEGWQVDTLLLEPGNPYDITPGELEPVRAQMARATPVRVAIAYQPHKGAGVTLVEVLNFWVPNAEFLRDEAYSVLLGMLIENMRRRFKRKHGAKRPKSIIVRDSARDGRVIETINIQAEDKPVVREPGDDDQTRPRPPIERVEGDEDSEGSGDVGPVEQP